MARFRLQNLSGIGYRANIALFLRCLKVPTALIEILRHPSWADEKPILEAPLFLPLATIETVWKWVRARDLCESTCERGRERE